MQYYNFDLDNFILTDIEIQSLHSNAPGTAIIIEPRKHPAFQLVINNIMNYLPSNWDLQIYCGLKNKDFCKRELNIISTLTKSNFNYNVGIPIFKNLFTDETLFNANKKYKNKNNQTIYLIQLPINNLTISEYSQLCLHSDLYSTATNENILIFQMDSCIINPKYNLSNFYKYNYIGPSAGKQKQYFNILILCGGFSFRKKSICLMICNWYLLNKDYFCNYPEDVVFSLFFHMYQKLPIPYESVLNSEYLTHKFAAGIATKDYSESFGIHKSWYGKSNKYLQNYLFKEYPLIKQLYNFQR